MRSQKVAHEMGTNEMNQPDQKKTVLVVDDAPANIQVVNSILKDIYKIRIATKPLRIAVDHPGIVLPLEMGVARHREAR